MTHSVHEARETKPKIIGLLYAGGPNMSVSLHPNQRWHVDFYYDQGKAIVSYKMVTCIVSISEFTEYWKVVEHD